MPRVPLPHKGGRNAFPKGRSTSGGEQAPFHGRSNEEIAAASAIIPVCNFPRVRGKRVRAPRLPAGRSCSALIDRNSGNVVALTAGASFVRQK